MTTVLALTAVGVLAALLVSAGCSRKPADDPLFHDPMANVEIVGAPRVSRTVQHRREQTSFRKPQHPSVTQVLQASGSGAPALAVRDALVEQARNAGWTFPADQPNRRGSFLGTKRVDDREATLSISVGDDHTDLVVAIMKN